MPTVPHDLENEARTNDEIFLEAAQRLKLAEEAESMNRVAALEDLAFCDDGKQWPDDLYKMRGNRPTLTINHTATFVGRIVNNMREQRPRIKCHPLGDGAQIADAEVINGLTRHIEANSQASVAYDTGGESAVKIGWGYWRVLSEYVDANSFMQELKIKPIRNPFTIYLDPSSQLPDGSDAEWCVLSEKMQRHEYKRLYPKADNAEWKRGAAGDAASDWESKQEIRIAEYYRFKHIKDTLYQLTDGRAMYKSELPSPEGMAAAGLAIAKNSEGREVSRPTTRRQLQWFRINGTKVVDSRDLPGKWIPVVRCEGNVFEINGRLVRKGAVRDLKDPARMYNYWKTAETELVALAPKAPFVGAQGQFDNHPEWDDANQRPYSKLVYNPTFGPEGQPVPPPQRSEPVAIPAGVVQAADGARQDLLALAGMPHEPGQDRAGEVISGKALRQRQWLSDSQHYLYYDKQTQAIAHTGRILLDLIPHYYSEERMQRIIGEDGQPQMVQLNQKDASAIHSVKNDVTVGRFDVVMDTGPGYESKRQEGSESLLELLRTPLGETVVKNGADLVVRAIDAPYMADLADRLAPLNPQGMQKMLEGLPKQAQSIVSALMQQSQQKDQVIQQLQMELKYKGSLEHFKQGEETKRELIRSRTKVHDTNTRAQASIDVAEIHEAGQLLNTNTEAAHDRRAAKDLIDNAQVVERRANGAG